MADITIEGYENYTINELGEVKNIKGKIIKHIKHYRGYRTVSLWKNNKEKRFYVHRLVATYFIDNKCNKPCVNHIDGNGFNNNINNLERCTNSENLLHAIHSLGKDLGHRRGCYGDMSPAMKVIYQYTKDKKLINKWYGAREAERNTGIGYKQISRVLCGGRKTTGGYIRSFNLL